MTIYTRVVELDLSDDDPRILAAFEYVTDPERLRGPIAKRAAGGLPPSSDQFRIKTHRTNKHRPERPFSA